MDPAQIKKELAELAQRKDKFSETPATESERAHFDATNAVDKAMAPLIEQYDALHEQLNKLSRDRSAKGDALWSEVAVRHGFKDTMAAHLEGVSFAIDPETMLIGAYRRKAAPAVEQVPAPAMADIAPQAAPSEPSADTVANEPQAVSDR